MKSNANVLKNMGQVLNDDYYDEESFISLKRLQLYDHRLTKKIHKEKRHSFREAPNPIADIG